VATIPLSLILVFHLGRGLPRRDDLSQPPGRRPPSPRCGRCPSTGKCCVRRRLRVK
jgi:hypothetical protein